MNFYEKDPEFARIFENFALNEVINEEGQELPQDIRYTAILATLLGCGGIDAFKEVLPEVEDEPYKSLAGGKLLWRLLHARRTRFKTA